mgnify:CR=1 FL=1
MKREIRVNGVSSFPLLHIRNTLIPVISVMLLHFVGRARQTRLTGVSGSYGKSFSGTDHIINPIFLCLCRDCE